MGICYIMGAMEPAFTPQIQPGDLLIAADAGYRQAKTLGMHPDLVVGDFDSLGFIPEGEQVEVHPVEKDDTDTMLAARIGYKRGMRQFVILGGMGGRLDHTIANLHTLAWLSDRGAKACMTDGREHVLLLQNESVQFSSGGQETISIFAYGGTARGVTLEGLHYPLQDAALDTSFPLGVSNRFEQQSALVRVEQGKLLVLWNGDFSRAQWLSEKTENKDA